MNRITRIVKHITVMVGVALLCLTVAESWAAEKKMPRRVIVAEEGGRSEPIHRVSIKSKIRGAVITTGGQEYAVDSETIVVDMDGKQVNFRKMMVPCDAEVTYRDADGIRKACRITITRIHDTASWELGPGGRPE